MSSKQCFCCKKTLPISEFYKNRARASGYHGECKKCQTKLAHKANLKRAHRIKEDLIFYKGSVCCRCGNEYPPVCYDLHHLDPSQKSFGFNRRISWKRVKEEADKCILLCANCHRIEHAKMRAEREEARQN